MKKSLRILHVEDSERDVTLVSRHLEESGYQLVSERVETADDMNAALAASEWDIILCNYSMPRFDALSALKVLRESGLDIPFLIISGTIGEDVAVKALLTGANDYILKDNLTRLKPSIERELLQAEERRAKRKTEDALKASEAELRALFAAIDDIVIVFDYDGRHLKVAPTNPKYMFKLGTNRIGKTVHEIYPPDFAHFLLTNIQTCLDESRTLNLEYSLSIDGNDRWFNGTVTPMTDHSAVWVARDITERKRAEEDLRDTERVLLKSEERYRDLVENATDIIFTHDLDGNYTSVNRVAELLTGFTKDEILAMNIADSISAEALEVAKTIIAAKLAGEEAPNHEVKLRTKDGLGVMVEVNSRIIYEDGIPIGVHGIARDITERLRAEEALRESNEKFHQLADNLTDVFWIRSRDMSKIHYISPAYEKIWGRPLRSDYADPDEWQGYIVPEDQQRVNDAYASLMDDAPNIEVEFRIVRPDDEIRWVRARGFQVRNIEGNIIRLAGIVTDITESRHSNEALAESEKRFRSVVETAPDVIVTIDDENRIYFINPAAEKTFGYSVDEIKGASLTMLMPERLRHMHEAGFQRYLQDGVKHVSWNLVEASGLHKSGREIPITISFSEYVQDGRRYFTGIIRDISDRKQAMEALQKSEERYRELVENALDIIYTHDLKGNYTSANKAAEVITGYTNAESLALNMADTINPAQVEKAKKMIAAKLAGENITAYELELIAKDGHTVPVEVNTRLIYENGVAVGIQGIARDITARKLAEKSLAELTERTEKRERMLTTMLSSISDFAQIYDPEGRILFVNQAVLNLWGRTLEDVVGKTFHDLEYPEELATKLLNQIVQVYRTKKPITDETPFTGVDGTPGFHEYIFSPAISPDGRVDFVVGSTRDVTERKQAQAALIESQEQLTLATEAADIGIWDWDLVKGTMKWDARMYDLYGNHDEDFSGPSKTWKLNHHPDDDKRVIEELVTAFKGPGDFHSEFRVVWPSGEVRHLESSAKVLREQNGTALRFIGINWDITERKAAEAALKAAEENYRSIFENAVEGICQSTLEGRFISANPATARILGFDSPEELIASRDIASQHYVDPAMRVQLQALLEEHGVIASYEVEVYKKDGSKIWTRENMRAIRGTDGQIHHYEGSIEDITARKSLEDQFRQSQKMEAVGVMAGGIAHDFNNLLTAINGYSDLTLSGMSPDDPLRRNIEEVLRAGERAAELTNQLLAFSRKQVFKPVVHNLNSVIETIEKMLRRIIPENIELRTVLDVDLGNIMADPGQVEQVIMNLAANARDAMPDGGTLTIETHNVYLDHKYISHKLAIEPGPFVRMTVSDTGTGIDASTQQHIFEPFFTTKEVGKGTGLGLSMVYGIVKQSGGDVLVYSEPGHGTTFKIYLPRVDKTIEKQKGIGDRIVSHVGTETVLLVEDEELVRNLVREILTANGYNVLEASSGDGALAICKSHSGPIHLLLTDVIMPKMGGREVKEEVLKLHPDIKVLFMSGYTDDSISHGGIFDSATEFIEKPFTPDRLIDKVRGVLEQ